MNSLTLAIEGMTCGHCVKTVRAALASIDGIQVTQLAIGSATIQVDETATSADAVAAAAVAAVSDAGYPARITTSVTPDQRATGGSCCAPRPAATLHPLGHNG